jgi:hypothetical protein
MIAGNIPRPPSGLDATVAGANSQPGIENARVHKTPRGESRRKGRGKGG